MSSRPGEIRAELPVRLPRPRDGAVLASREYVDLRRRGLALVREAAHQAGASAASARK